MTSWLKPFIPPKEIEDEAKDEFKKLFTGQIDIAQQQSTSNFCTLIFKLANPKRDYPRARKLANRFLVRRLQQNSEDLSKVSEQLKSGEKVSKLYRSFLPFLDESGILRSKSRLANVDHLAYEVRYPVLLDKQESLTKLIISSAHFKFAHTIGNSCCKAEISKGYLILSLENC